MDSYLPFQFIESHEGFLDFGNDFLLPSTYSMGNMGILGTSVSSWVATWSYNMTMEYNLSKQIIIFNTSGLFKGIVIEAASP